MSVSDTGPAGIILSEGVVRFGPHGMNTSECFQTAGNGLFWRFILVALALSVIRTLRKRLQSD